MVVLQLLTQFSIDHMFYLALHAVLTGTGEGAADFNPIKGSNDQASGPIRAEYKGDISMPLRLQFQLNVRTIHADFVGTHPLRRWRAEHLAGANLELRAMPGARDLVALEFPL